MHCLQLSVASFGLLAVSSLPSCSIQLWEKSTKLETSLVFLLKRAGSSMHLYGLRPFAWFVYAYSGVKSGGKGDIDGV
ncbi:SUR7/PalI family domain-containing protein [Pochonia chlamydosporia 170]|uniref:SUR7/PalI family domain-containing protein n=1 Tax=Pochonia chlamydosporia 170 TaxID=1380566 RepID=A0A179F471_METCM|nr:SUR7/PalI family domain-containing protein [Pochonia chlamydosporia 170]OAQ60205.2 SUR7/PalI family domain-containing protein [Pochonia chlamydosporia 170]